MQQAPPGTFQGGHHVYRKMLHALEIQDVDEIIPPEDDIKLLDPITENQNLLNMVPVKAYADQNQDAHIQDQHPAMASTS